MSEKTTEKTKVDNVPGKPAHDVETTKTDKTQEHTPAEPAKEVITTEKTTERPV